MQSHFIGMNRPYPIVRYGLEVAMQIGTLVVVKESENEDGGYAIETHSHPVVSYINRERGKILMPREILPESVVWNEVEASDVEYLCLENEEEFRWKHFSYIVSHCVWGSIVFEDKPEYSYAFRLRDLFRHLGIPVEPIVAGTYEIDLTYEDADPVTKFCYGNSLKLTERDGSQTDGGNINGVFTFWAVDGDLGSMYEAIRQQVHAFIYFDASTPIFFHFKSSDGKYTELAERLNKAFDKK